MASSQEDMLQFCTNTIKIMYNYKLEKGEKLFKLRKPGKPKSTKTNNKGNLPEISYICCPRDEIELEAGEMLIEMTLDDIFNDRESKTELFMAIMDDVFG